MCEEKDIDYIDVYDDGPYDIYDIDDYDNDVLNEQKIHKCHDPILKNTIIQYIVSIVKKTDF